MTDPTTFYALRTAVIIARQFRYQPHAFLEAAYYARFAARLSTPSPPPAAAPSISRVDGLGTVVVGEDHHGYNGYPAPPPTAFASNPPIAP